MAIPTIIPPSIEEIRSIRTIEGNEPLVKIAETQKILILKENQFLLPFARKSVVENLINASENLPAGHKFLIVTAYRPLSFQKKLWRQRLWQMIKKKPLRYILNPLSLFQDASKYTARPGGSSHQTGAAIDLTIIDQNNKRLDMGTELTDFGEKCHTSCSDISSEQKNNREILYKTMIESGFVNYPREWWHYSYGDRAWSVMNNKKECDYGALKFERSDIIKK